MLEPLDAITRFIGKLKEANRERDIEERVWKGNQRRAMEDARQKARVVVDSKPKPKPVVIETPKPKTKKELEREKRDRTYQQNKKFGYVYLMRSGNGYHKIGISKNTRNRLDGLKRQYPVQIEVIHQIACHDYRAVERNLHKMFASKRAEYEWFNLDSKDVKWIKAKKDYQLG